MKLSSRNLTLPFLPLLLLTTMCSAAPAADDDVDSTSEGVSATCGTATYNWDDFPVGTGQCFSGVQNFYAKHFDVDLPNLGSDDEIDGCAFEGACQLWVRNLPSAAQWDRFTNGSVTPQQFDMVVYPPVSNDPAGHVASVDHVDSKGNVFVMDDNYLVPDRKATCVHTVPRTPYGYYRLKSLEVAPPPPVPSCVAGGVADFNGDGKSDLLVRGVSGWDTTPVFLSKGDGSFTLSNPAGSAGSVFNAPGAQSFVGDFNGDGKTDVLVKGVSGWDTTPIFFSKGDGTFTFSNVVDPTKLFNLPGTQTLVGDFNHDGRTDVMIRGISGWDTTPIFFSNGDGTFRFSNAPDPMTTVFNTTNAQAFVGDFNGDGKSDVVLKNGTNWTTDPVYLSNGDGSFTYRAGNAASDVFNYAGAQTFIGDFNGDGKSDVLVRGVSGWKTTPVFLSNGDGTFTFSNPADSTQIFNLPAAQAFVGDFNGDGKTDLLVKGISGWDTTPVFFSNGDGTFRFSNDPDPSEKTFNFVGAETLLGDFNGDHKTDVLLKNGTGWTTTPLFLSNGDGTFAYSDDANSSGSIFNYAGAASLCY